MSTQTPNDIPVITTIADPAVEGQENVEKQPNVLVRGWRTVRSNPKTAIAVVGVAALGVVSYGLGRKAGSSDEPLALNAPDDTVGDLYVMEYPESNDTEIA